MDLDKAVDHTNIFLNVCNFTQFWKADYLYIMANCTGMFHFMVHNNEKILEVLETETD